MGKKGKSRRQKMIVNPALQRRLIMDVTRFPIIAFLTGMVIVCVIFWLTLQMADMGGVELPWVYPLIVSMVGLLFITNCYLILNTAMRISNRVAGPLYRLQKTIEQVEKGVTGCRVNFRKGDYLLDTAEDFNRLFTYIDELQRKLSSGESPSKQESEARDTACVGAKETDP